MQRQVRAGDVSTLPSPMAARVDDAIKDQMVLIVMPASEEGSVKVCRGSLPPGGKKVEKPFISGAFQSNDAEGIFKSLADQRGEFGSYYNGVSLFLSQELPPELRRRLMELNGHEKKPFPLRKQK